MKTSTDADSPGVGAPIVVGGAIASVAVLATAAGLATRRIMREKRRLQESSKLGREASVGLPSTGLPLTSVNRNGQLGDPINVECIGTNNQLGVAFAAAG